MLVNSKFYMNVECKYFSKEQKIHFICVLNQSGRLITMIPCLIIRMSRMNDCKIDE